MCKTKRHCAIKIHTLVKNLCYFLTYVVVDDIVGNMLESMYNVFMIRGND